MSKRRALNRSSLNSFDPASVSTEHDPLNRPRVVDCGDAGLYRLGSVAPFNTPYSIRNGGWNYCYCEMPGEESW